MSSGTTNRLPGRVKAVWRREQTLRFGEGALGFLLLFVPFFIAAVLLDWTLDLPSPARWVLLSLVLGLPLLKACRAGWRYLRPFNATRTALQIEEQSGGMESLLVTAVQLSAKSTPDGTSEALGQLACRKAEEASGAIRARDTIDFDSLRRPVIVTLGALAIVALLLVSHGQILLAGIQRILTPWLDIEYPTRTQLVLAAGDMVVQEGKPVRIAADISGVVPKRAKIYLRAGKGRARVRKLDITDGKCEYVIDTAYRGFKYRLNAGDARSDWYKVDVIAAPRIEVAKVNLEYPPYTKRAAETLEALTLTVPETTKVGWTLTLDRAVRDAKMTLSGGEAIPMAISDDGMTVTYEQTATESRAYGFAWVDRDHDFSFKSSSHYLQVAPDRPPSVELTSPERNVYAMLGRPLDLAFRGRDDHGVAESTIMYRVDKIEEVKVPFIPAKPIDGNEQVIDWDYRNAITNIVIGQTIAFALELADAYPGEKGPHRVRSESRRIQFMSKDDYLAQIEKQKKRLLSRLRTIYRDERKVHEMVMRLDSSDPVFIQTCQLEAVRQDLMRERVNRLAGGMSDLSEDLTANGITNKTMIASLDTMREDLARIAEENLSQAANSLRTLAGESRGGRKNGVAAKSVAARTIDAAARELGLLVLHLSYTDAADVMARELHAAAETQAALRLRTIMLSEAGPGLADEQEMLAKWLTRLFAASPKDRESTVQDALIEFTLTRMVKRMVNEGIDDRLKTTAALISEKKSADAARLQAEVISSLLRSEFRLRVGAEREALVKARNMFLAQANQQAKLREEIGALDEKVLKKRRKDLGYAQQGLHKQLQLLLMPEIPARRTKLFDQVVPSPPPALSLLSTADAAMTAAAGAISKGDRGAGEKAQRKVEESFLKLADIVTARIEAMSQAVRIGRLAYAAKDIEERLIRFGERQLSLLEKTEDAAAEGTKSAYLASQQEGLAEAVEELRDDLVRQRDLAPTKSEHSPAVIARISEVAEHMRRAIPLLKSNKPKEAVAYEKAIGAALVSAQELVTEHTSSMSAFASAVAMTDAAVKPSPYVREIEEEQRDMLKVTEKTKPEDLHKLAVPQKNLVHAVNAILAALDPVAHKVESGTVMLFAKDDMDAAATAMVEKDPVEALDAQDYIVETMGDLRGKLEAVIPQYRYVLEIVEELHESSQEGVLIRESQLQLARKLVSGADPKSLAKEQGLLKVRAQSYAKTVNRVVGLGLIEGTAKHMAAAETALAKGDKEFAGSSMAQATTSIMGDAGTIAQVNSLVPYLLAAPVEGMRDPPEVVLVKQVLDMAGNHKVTFRDSCAAKPNQLNGYESKLSEFAKACDPFIAQAKGHKNPVPGGTTSSGGRGESEPVVQPAKSVPPANLHLKLVQAKKHLSTSAAKAKAKDRAKVVSEQVAAADALRYFIVEYSLKFVVKPGPPPPQPPAPSDDFSESEDEMNLFMPGAVTGVKPPDGKLEWEVLGKRDRAALNENFARELPLEYRAILKDYYERLAR